MSNMRYCSADANCFSHQFQVGHSLGGALAQLDSLFFKLNLPEGTVVKSVALGTPRVGITAYVRFFESKARNNCLFRPFCSLVPHSGPRENDRLRCHIRFAPKMTIPTVSGRSRHISSHRADSWRAKVGGW